MMVNMVGKIISQLKEQGLSILLVEQNLPLALKLSDYLYIMWKGVIVCESINENSKENEEMVARHICI
jgi:branched-chain amino acid transport system ATP-binding protein